MTEPKFPPPMPTTLSGPTMMSTLRRSLPASATCIVKARPGACYEIRFQDGRSATIESSEAWRLLNELREALSDEIRGMTMVREKLLPSIDTSDDAAKP